MACPTCLRLLRLPGPVSVCPYCGGLLAAAEAERLAGILDGLEARLTGQLLEGRPAAELVAGLAEQGIAQDRAWEFADRLLSELPFERHPAWKAGRPVPPPPACDACGVSGASLAAWEADWRIQPEELQRYRSGWGGFEGDFVKRGHYTRQALYYLCPGCSKALRTPGFASGYPHRFGFRIERFRKLDRL